MEELNKVLKLLRTEFPEVKIVRKEESFFMNIINVFLLIFTFGQMRTYMTEFTTVIGNTIYVPSKWDAPILMSKLDKASVLRHEMVHLRQSKKIGPWFYGLTYLFLPFPVVFAIGRRNLEQEAYEESMRARAEYYGLHTLKYTTYKNWLFENFTSAKYFWMWPFKKQLNEWFDKTYKKLEKEFEN